MELDIDMFLMRLNKVFPEPVAVWSTYVLPVLAFVSLVATVLTIIVFRRQKSSIGVQRLVSCILVLTTISLLVRVPLFSLLLGNNDSYADYLEYKWCEIFTRVNFDTPFVISNMTALLKVGVAVQGFILMFVPKKEKVWMSSHKTVWFCIFVCIAGVLVYIPNMFLTEYISLLWTSKLYPNEERETCIAFPHATVLNVPYYQRNVMIGQIVVNSAFPIFTMTITGIILAVRLHHVKRMDQSDNEVSHRHSTIRIIIVLMFIFIFLMLSGTGNVLVVTLVYAMVDFGLSMDNIQIVIAYFYLGETLSLGLLSPAVFSIFCFFDNKFRSASKGIVRRSTA